MATREELQEHSNKLDAVIHTYRHLMSREPQTGGIIGKVLAHHRRAVTAALKTDADEFPDFDVDSTPAAPDPDARSLPDGKSPWAIGPRVPAIGSRSSVATYQPIAEPPPREGRLARMFAESDADQWAQRANDIEKQLVDTRCLPKDWRKPSAQRIINEFCQTVSANHRLPPDDLRTLRARMEAIADA